MSNTAITGCYKLLNPPPHHPAYLFESSGDQLIYLKAVETQLIYLKAVETPSLFI